MAVPVHVPRVNNNDDEVKLVELLVTPGTAVAAGDRIAAVETDKAIVDVEAPMAGFLLTFEAEIDSTVRVGSVLAWIGDSADETPPRPAAEATADAGGQPGQPTAKARALLQAHGLQAAQVAASSARLSVADVERHIAQRGLRPLAPAKAAAPAAGIGPRPDQPGTPKALRPDQRGMLATVSWQRDHAVPGYIEITFDQTPWVDRAAALQKEHGLLLNPLLPLLAWRLVGLAAERPALNATIVDDARYEYTQVNLGFTVQAGDVLYLAVTRNAAAMGELGFVQHLIDVQRRAAGHKLQADETMGATIGFSSMARWKVSRHVPVLAPLTALMVAHTQAADGQGVLAATYDHRVLHGADVAGLLRKLSQPRAA
jgi:pyruvate/2-oxoglutarate dehydrogenase complex dihydrolipoamide acyltransferase (E2) component